jgi:hypothetical protein
MMVCMTTRNEIDHAADLKGELVDYALTPGFTRRLNSALAESLEFSDDRHKAVVHAVEGMLLRRISPPGSFVPRAENGTRCQP